jgi:hypothetical protein
MTKKATALKWTLIAGALYFFLVSAAHFFEIKWPGVFVYFNVESFQYQNKIISLLAFGWATYFYASTRFIPLGLIQEILFPVIAGALAILVLSYTNLTQEISRLSADQGTLQYWLGTLFLLVYWLVLFSLWLWALREQQSQKAAKNTDGEQ